MRGEAAAVEEDVDDALELDAQTVEREVLAPELEGIGALDLRRRQCGVELFVVVPVQPERPRLRVGDIGGPPFGRWLQLVHVGGIHVSSSRSQLVARTRRPGSAPVGSPSWYVIWPPTTVAR